MRAVVGAAFGRGALAIDVCDQTFDDGALFQQQHAAYGFGGMRGEHRLDPHTRQQLSQLIQSDAVVAQGAQHRAQAAGLGRGAAALVIAAAADAVNAFGQIHHAEVGGESTDEGIGIRQRHRGETAGELVDGVALLTARDRGAAHGFHLLQQFCRNLFGQHVADHRTQPPHVVAQQGVGFGEFEGVADAHQWTRSGVRVTEITQSDRVDAMNSCA
jgi:hypothetical protein